MTDYSEDKNETPEPKEKKIDCFWKARAKVGRKRIFETPEDMFNAAQEYFYYQSSRTLNETQFTGSQGKKVIIPHVPPFTWEGLTMFLHVNTVYFNKFEAERKKENTDQAREFCKIITHVRETIRLQKFEGAMVGMYNANITARDLGLTDKKDVTTDGQSIGISVNVQDPALKAKLDKE